MREPIHRSINSGEQNLQGGDYEVVSSLTDLTSGMAGRRRPMAEGLRGFF
jgi:hypothetical protein